MNEATYSGLLARLLYRVMLGTRYLDTNSTCGSIGLINGMTQSRAYT